MTTDQSHYDVAIVGGGITGLSAAWTLQQRYPSLTYALLEGSDRWGGKILTDELDRGQQKPFVIEGGPDSFITQKPWALQLAHSLGLSNRLLPTNDDRRRVFVLNRGRPTPLPDGVMLIVPTQLMPFAASPLISLPGKLRMGLDWKPSDTVSFLFRYQHSDTDDPTFVQTNAVVQNGRPLTIGGIIPGTIVATKPGEVAQSATQPVSFTAQTDIYQLTGQIDVGFADLSSYTQYRTEKTQAFSDLDYRDVAEVAAHYYSLVLTDTGTGIVHSVMAAALGLADQMVIVSGLSVDEARLASETLTWLEANGYGELVRNAVVAINLATQGTHLVKVDEIEAHFASRVREIVRIPYDPQLAAGSVVHWSDLRAVTQHAARELAALVVEGLPVERGH